VGDGGLAVLYVGRLAAEKGLDLVLRAFDAVAGTRPEARLVLVGDGPERARLRRRRQNLFCPGQRVGVELARHYASADLFLFPSLTETYGNVVAEAMASGLAVLAFDYAAAAEHLVHGRNGLLVPFGDRDGFVAAAHQAAVDPAALSALGAAARERALGLGWDTVVERFAALCAEASAIASLSLATGRLAQRG
jgi:glycosyltransferase involved in cell wall biosynthesis